MSKFSLPKWELKKVGRGKAAIEVSIVRIKQSGYAEGVSIPVFKYDTLGEAVAANPNEIAFISTSDFYKAEKTKWATDDEYQEHFAGTNMDINFLVDGRR